MLVGSRMNNVLNRRGGIPSQNQAFWGSTLWTGVDAWSPHWATTTQSNRQSAVFWHGGIRRKCGSAAARWLDIQQEGRSYSTKTALFSTTSSSSSSSSVSSQPPAAQVFKVPKKFVPFPFDYHQELILRIDTLTNLGMGIGRIDINEMTNSTEEGKGNETLENSSNDPPNQSNNNSASSSWVVMVPNVIPEEIVKVRIFRNHKGYSEADLLEVVEASPERIEPKCPLAGQCGGCQYQHVPIELQRTWKQKHVEDGFRQHGLMVDDNDHKTVVEPTLGTEHIYHYRSKITPHYQAPARSRRGRPNEDSSSSLIQSIGFQRSTVRQIIDVPECAIATLPINQKYQQLRQELLFKPSPNAKKLGATLLLRQANPQDEEVITDHKTMITTQVLNKNFTYLAGNFFQNNLFVVPLMVEQVLEQALLPEKTRMTHFIDCYCGSGLFCISVAEHFDHAVGIEINDKAVEEARQNALANNNQCTFQAARAEAIFDNPVIDSFPPEKTVVMLDPPRKGCDDVFLNQLKGFLPQRIIYMSCNPATQARDAAKIVEWGYDITFIQPFDLFPQTRHIECLAVFEKRHQTASQM